MDFVLIYTFREAPSSAALQNAAPTPASLIASAEPFAANSAIMSIASQHFSMISIGTEQASFSTISITLAFSAFSSSVSLGIPYAFESGSNTSASLSISVSKSAWSLSHFAFSSYISASTSAYFFLPTVRLPTIFPSAVPIAPTSADAPPPPGTGAFDASTSTNSLHGTVENPIVLPPVFSSCCLALCCKKPDQTVRFSLMY